MRATVCARACVCVHKQYKNACPEKTGNPLFFHEKDLEDFSKNPHRTCLLDYLKAATSLQKKPKKPTMGPELTPPSSSQLEAAEQLSGLAAAGYATCSATRRHD